MAISKTTFAERMSKIEKGHTTSWTVPGAGLAEIKDERSFYKKEGIKMVRSSKSARRNPVMYVAALIIGATSVIAARWIDFTYQDTALALAADKGLDAASIISGVPTSLALAAMISLFAMFVLGLRTRQTLALQATGFLGAMMFEGDLMALAPDLYARFYPQSWITDMMASASLLT